MWGDFEINRNLSLICHQQLLRSSNTLAQLHDGATEEIHSSISKMADAYHEASILSNSPSAAAYHARFLKQLIIDNNLRAKQSEKERYQQQQSIRSSESRYQCKFQAVKV